MTEDKLIAILSASYFWPGADREDVEQEARYALERARLRYRPGRCAFLSFAWVCVKAHLIEQVRRETQRRPQFAMLQESHELPANVHDLVEARETLRLVVSMPLSNMERFMLGRAIRGESIKDEKWMDNALYRARRKLKAAA